MSFQLGVVMDPLHNPNFALDTTLGILQAAMHRDWSCYVFTPDAISWQDGQCMGRAKPLKHLSCDNKVIELGDPIAMPMLDLNACLLRVDPPFDKRYYQLTILLERASQQGLCIMNDPRGVRDSNEKCFPLSFPDCCPPTLISADEDAIVDFMKTHERIIIKPLDEGAGRGIFLLEATDPNHRDLLARSTEQGQQWIVAQRYLPDIKQGDKRIILIHGEAIDCALARIPQEGKVQANIAAGGRTVIQDLSDRDRWICEQIGPALKARQLMFVGIDVIGDYLTEINVTSPTGMRQIENETPLKIADPFLDQLESLSCAK